MLFASTDWLMRDRADAVALARFGQGATLAETVSKWGNLAEGHESGPLRAHPRSVALAAPLISASLGSQAATAGA